MTWRSKLKYWLYGSCPGFAGSFPYFATRVYFPKGSLSFAAACDQGIFEAHNVRLLQSLVRPGTFFLDVGTNIGLMSLPILNGNPDVHVVSFEASPNVLPYLTRTIAGSGRRDRWTLVPKAVGAAVGKVQFSLSALENSLYDGIKATRRVEAVRQVEVEMTTLDKWWQEAGRPAISAIKCDVEGAELEVLRGARECLARQRPHVLLEWNRQNLTAYGLADFALVDFAAEAGYKLYALPNLIGIDSKSELGLQMIATESFLLVPLDRQ